MTTVLKAIDGGSKQRSEARFAEDSARHTSRKGNQQDSKDKSIRLHCKISIEDINWVRQQPPCVQQLWLDSVAAEQFGGAAHKLETNLTYKSFQKAGAALSAQGLFQFEEVFGRLPSGRPGLIGHRVRNLHGYYNRFYWESNTTEENNSFDPEAVHAEQKTNQAELEQNHPEMEQIHADLETFQKNDQKTDDLQGFQNPNNVANYSLTTTQLPTKVVGMGDSSDALPEITGSNQTRSSPDGRFHPADFAATAPFGGASPECDESVEKEEKNAAAAIVGGEVFRTEASGRIASRNEDTLVVPCSTSQDCSDINQFLDQDCFSAAAPINVEKWSPEAIAQRIQQRPGRQDKLKRAGMFGDNPGFEYLQECWNDPSLRIMVRRLIAKFPQWRVACIQEELVDWEVGVVVEYVIAKQPSIDYPTSEEMALIDDAISTGRAKALASK